MLNCFCNVLISIIIIIIVKLKKITQIKIDTKHRNLVRFWLEWGRNLVGIWSEYGRKWSKNTSLFNSDSARNDSEKLGMAKNLSLNFFYFFTRNEVGIWSDLLRFLPFRSECVGEGKVLYFYSTLTLTHEQKLFRIWSDDWANVHLWVRKLSPVIF